MRDKPTERDIEAAAYPIHEAECTAYTHEGRNARCHRAARAILASEWYAERIAETRREGAADALARVSALADEWWGRATEATSAPTWRQVTHELRAALVDTTPPATEEPA